MRGEFTLKGSINHFVGYYAPAFMHDFMKIYKCEQTCVDATTFSPMSQKLFNSDERGHLLSTSFVQK